VRFGRADSNADHGATDPYLDQNSNRWQNSQGGYKVGQDGGMQLSDKAVRPFGDGNYG
jgi:hypothetical protein